MEKSSVEPESNHLFDFPEATFDIVAFAASAGGLNALMQVFSH